MNLKTIIITVAILSAIYGSFYFVKDYFEDKEKLEISDKNEAEFIKEKNAMSTNLKLTSKEFNEYIKFAENQFTNFEKQLKEKDIKLKHIQIVNAHKIKVTDTVLNIIEIDSFVYKLAQNKPMRVPFIDSTECFKIEGAFVYENEKALIEIQNKEFTGTLKVLRHDYRERKKYIFGLIKTKLFSKLQTTETYLSPCLGEIKSTNIEIIKD